MRLNQLNIFPTGSRGDQVGPEQEDVRVGVRGEAEGGGAGEEGGRGHAAAAEGLQRGQEGQGGPLQVGNYTDRKSAKLCTFPPLGRKVMQLLSFSMPPYCV